MSALWQGADVYELPGGGLVYGSPRLGLKLTLSHDTPFFQGNPICPFHATLDTTLSGPWVLTCYGAEQAIDLTGVLVLVPCEDSVERMTESLQHGGRLAGNEARRPHAQ